MSTSKHRLFIGIPLNDLIRDFLNTRVDELKHQLLLKQITWVPKENYHVTLLFLGSVETEKLSVIKENLTKIEQRLEAFPIEINGVILFPNPKHPKIIAAKIQLTESLGKLHATLYQEMSSLGFKLDERPYLPHVTLGRIKHGICSPDEAKRNPGIPDAPVHQSQLITQLVLFESLQTTEGTRYKIVSK